MTFGSLFAGIGGLDLGFERAGWQCEWQVEIDDYANKVLAKHWPNVRRHRDIRTFPEGDPADWRVDCVVGGFPCQDISYAGRGAGLSGERSGLFYEAMRVVRELEPRFVVLENVAALLTRGLDAVLGTLASLGFDAEWHCVPAAAVGAPHIRDRVFIVAHAVRFNQSQEPQGNDGFDGQRAPVGRGQLVAARPGTVRADCRGNQADGTAAGRSTAGINAAMDATLAHTNSSRRERPRWGVQSDRDAPCGDEPCNGRAEVPDAHSPRLQEREGANTGGPGTQKRAVACRSERWATEPAVGRVANGVPARVDRLRGLGNAVVPQVAEWIARAVAEGGSDGN